MKKLLYVLIIFISTFVMSRCSQTRPGVFSNDVLPAQKFEIDISKDTMIQTAGGMVVSIKAGSLSSPGGDKVVLQIKEALQFADMIKAGLTTTANEELLSSGGMFFIEPEDKSVQIISPLEVRIPTDFIENTNLYKGTETDGKINWDNPEPVQEEKPVNPFAAGESLFKMNCTQCHTVGKGRIIGPDLVHITKRRDYHWLEAFTRNSQQFMYDHDFALPTSDTTATNRIDRRYLATFYYVYSLCHYNEYHKTVMTPFNLSDEEIHQLYDYIENESNRLRLPMPEDKLFHCVDSCLKYNILKAELEKKRDALIKDNGKVINAENTPPPGSSATQLNTAVQNPNLIEPVAVVAKYYQVNIKTFGWYNIDILLKDMNGVENSNLIVRLRGTYSKEISLFLAIPSHKVYAHGGKLTTGDDDYGFFEKDGTIPLPQRQTVYVFAAGESNGKFIFGNAEFTAAMEQTITIEPVEVSKEIFDKAIKKMSADDIQVSLDETKNAGQIRELEKKLDDIETVKPKNCDCNCATFGADISPLFP